MSDDGSQTQNPPQPTVAEDARSTAGMEQLLDQAEADLAAADGPAAATDANPQPFSLNELQHEDGIDELVSMNLLSDVDLDLRIELGRTHMRLEDVLQLRSGSVVALDRLAGDPVDVFVNDRLVARGEVLVLNESFCVRVTELVTGGNA
ncbi:Flagellar motor switch protein FliN [Rosistilla carotiformis]|uniref:Flagellar motor switch protein FliN n=1 Tax=Rosistilla carotiformis TaxID=2528017 RepID=A0A518K1Y0_9BACT|nr:flagellar motor switch protein FliN [Rosistilla carotiformis]QDV71782.1 Flagellar motor switch protein FliN [Rosistilla carotiformis]